MLLWNQLKVKITNPAGSVRSGRTPSALGTWTQYLPYDYGELVGTKGTDGKPINVILGKSETQFVFVAQMTKAFSGEDKVLLGFNGLASAKKAFLSCYGGDVAFLDKIKRISLSVFQKRLTTHKGLSLLANFQSSDFSTLLNVIQPLPTGWNTKVVNPGDELLTKEDRAFNVELARRQGSAPSYATVSQGADMNVSPSYIYSSKGSK